MNPVSVVAVAVGAVGVVGQFLDGYTTYKGIFVKKIAVEGNQSWFAQLVTKRAWTCLTVKPVLTAAVIGLMLWAGPQSDFGAYAGDVIAIGLGALATWSGFNAAKGNATKNSAAK